LSRPWRLLLLLASIVGVSFGGFRTSLILLLLTFAILFFLQGLHRTKYMFSMVAALILGSILLVPVAHKLPLSVQRSLSVLPLNLDPAAKMSAEMSSQWRIEMWQQVLPEIPKYLLRGKGYALDPQEVEQFNVTNASKRNWAGALLSGDYHNGPLSVIIPFGIYGALAFAWFLFACHRLMWRYLKHGHPSLRNINALLLAFFAARTVVFFFVFGALNSDMAIFAGLVGLSVALNAAVQVPAAQVEETAELESDFSRGLSPFS
jgi:O-antigen ligase